VDPVEDRRRLEEMSHSRAHAHLCCLRTVRHRSSVEKAGQSLGNALIWTGLAQLDSVLGVGCDLEMKSTLCVWEADPSVVSAHLVLVQLSLGARTEVSAR